MTEQTRHRFEDQQPKPGERVQLWAHEWEGPRVVWFQLDRHGPYWHYQGRSMPAWGDDMWAKTEAS